MTEVDLDAVPEAVPRPHRPLLVAAAVVALVALVGAATARAALTRPTARPLPAVTAWVGLRSVVPDRSGLEPFADLFITVANRGAEPLTLRDVTFAGPRIGAARPAVEVRHLPAGELVTFTARKPLACGPTPIPAGRRDAGIDVEIAVTGADAVHALPVGRLAAPDGACRAIAADLPAGFDTQVRVESARFSRQAATLQVAGLPAAAKIVGVYADGWILPIEQVGPAASPGGWTLRIGAPSPTCSDRGTRGVLSVGLQLRLLEGGALTTAYAPVGPALAGWLLEADYPACAP